MSPHYIQNTSNGACVHNHHAKIIRDNGAVIVIDGGGYGQVVAKEAMDIGIERARSTACAWRPHQRHHRAHGRIGAQCARAW